MTRTIEKEYGCFKCGEVRPRVIRDPTTDRLRCKECGEYTIVTFRQALDVIYEYSRRRLDEITELMQFDEYYPDVEEDNNE